MQALVIDVPYLCPILPLTTLADSWLPPAHLQVRNYLAETTAPNTAAEKSEQKAEAPQQWSLSS